MVRVFMVRVFKQDVICGENMPHSHIHIIPAYGNGESDSLCGKICDMHTIGKYANNTAIAYSHKTGMPI